jgi:hypothetical protein
MIILPSLPVTLNPTHSILSINSCPFVGRGFCAKASDEVECPDKFSLFSANVEANEASKMTQ